MDQAERKILDMIEQGVLTAEEGLRLIDAMNVGKSEDDDGYNLSPEEVMVSADDIVETSKSRISTKELERMKQLKRWWVFSFCNWSVDHHPGRPVDVRRLQPLWFWLGVLAFVDTVYHWDFYVGVQLSSESRCVVARAHQTKAG